MMKVGLLIKDFDALENWELRIIEYLKNNPNLELTLLIKDGRIKEKTKNKLSNFLFDRQVLFEKGRYLKNLKRVNRKELITFLNNIPTLIFMPKNDIKGDIFGSYEAQQVKNYRLDIILKLEFNRVSGEIVNAAKYGIWQIDHSDYKIGRLGPPGFWEVLHKKPTVKVSLLKLTNEIDKKQVIDTAFFNRHRYSYIETNFKVLESSISLIFKNLQKLANGNELKIQEEKLSHDDTYKIPNLLDVLQYQLNFYYNFGKSFFKKIEYYFGRYEANWTLFIGKGDFLDADLMKLVPVKKPKGEFWADPFLFEYKNELFVFFERFPFKTQKGVISCGKVEGNNLVEVRDVLDLPYHMSYPFVFEEEGDIYMMPETSSNNRLEIYKCVKFPFQWKLQSTAFEGEQVADSFFYNDDLQQKWLFLNKSSGPGTSLDNELYIYRVDSVNLTKIEPHNMNPIHIDTRVARNGGSIFEYQNKIYRPSQRNIDGIYGKALNISQIEKLTLEKYSEKTKRIVEPNFQKGLKSIHHLHQIDDMFIFDGALKL